MNTKRQTIWLVSMLSLMVVLSAYYLFTQDLNDADKLSEADNPGHNVTEAVGGDGSGLVLNGGALSGEEVSALDRQVLEQLEKEGFANGGQFSELLAKRDQQYQEENNRIWSVIADVTNDPAASTAAMGEMEMLEEKYTKIQELEEALMEQYQLAIVAEENDRYKVVITSQKLEKKDAAGIIEQVMTQLGVKPSQVSVQYVPEP